MIFLFPRWNMLVPSSVIVLKKNVTGRPIFTEQDG